MLCRHCGTEIADKAIVCYRCGAGTMDPVRRPAAIRRRSPLLPVVILILAALIAYFLGHTYHVFGVELFSPHSPYGAVVLIHCPAFHA
jgi:hypothetical protein